MGNAITRKYDIDETHCANAGLSGCWKIYKGKTKDEIPKEISVWICSKDEVGKRTPAPDRSTLDQLFQVMRKDVMTMKDMPANNHVVKPLEVFQDSQSILCFVTERVVCSLADVMGGFSNVPGGFFLGN